MKALSVAALVVFIAAAPGGTAAPAWPAWVEPGWTLVHSVWQFAAVVLVAGLVEIALRRSKASVRYAAAAVALGVILVLPTVTWMCVEVSPSPAGDAPHQRSRRFVQPVRSRSYPCRNVPSLSNAKIRRSSRAIRL